VRWRCLILGMALLLGLTPARAQQDSVSDFIELFGRILNLPAPQTSTFDPSRPQGSGDTGFMLRALTAALEGGQTGTPTEWNNPATGSSGAVTSLSDRQLSGRQTCRTFRRITSVGGGTEIYVGTACRQSDGWWTIRDEHPLSLRPYAGTTAASQFPDTSGTSTSTAASGIVRGMMVGAEAAAKSGGSGDRIAQVAPAGDDATGAAPGQPKARTAFKGKEYTIVPRAGHSSEIHSVAFSPDGRLALTGSEDNTAKMWDVATGRELRTLAGDTGTVTPFASSTVTSVAFSPDGRLALTGTRSRSEFGSPGTVKLWDVATGRELRTLEGHADGGVTSIAFSPDGRLALTGSEDNTATLWDVATGRGLRILAGHWEGVTSVAFSPDGRLALTGSSDNYARLWGVATGRELRTLAHPEGVDAVAFSPDGRLALTLSGDGTVKLWEVATGRELRTLAGHSVTSVAFSPNGRLALTGSRDGTATLWEVATGRELRTLAGIRAKFTRSPSRRMAGWR